MTSAMPKQSDSRHQLQGWDFVGWETYKELRRQLSQHKRFRKGIDELIASAPDTIWAYRYNGMTGEPNAKPGLADLLPGRASTPGDFGLIDARSERIFCGAMACLGEDLVNHSVDRVTVADGGKHTKALSGEALCYGSYRDHCALHKRTLTAIWRGPNIVTWRIQRWWRPCRETTGILASEPCPKRHEPSREMAQGVAESRA